MAKALTTKQGRVWIQPDGPGNPSYLLSCRTGGDLSAPEGGLEVIRCFNDAGDGWDVIGDTESPPEVVTFSLDTNLFNERDWLERITCPFSMYILSRDCGRADVFTNYVRGQILSNARRANRTYSDLVNRDEATASTLSTDIEAWPPLLDVNVLDVDRIASVETEDINDVDASTALRCDSDCGATLGKGQDAQVVTDASAGAAADAYITTNSGVTFTVTTTRPFAVGVANHIMSTARCYIGRNTIRRFAAKLFGAGAQGVVAYSDDNGATAWISANVGGAAAGHGAVLHDALYFDGPTFGFLASALGFIYKTIDGGVTWVAKESGSIAAGNYNAVHFADRQYGIAVGAADVVSISDDGGEVWQAATATGSGAALNTCWRFSKNRALVGTATGRLYQTKNAGVTWTRVTGFYGDGVGEVRSLSFINSHQGLMTKNSAAAVTGKILLTNDGGYSWETLTTPTNSGLNGVFMASDRLGYAVGDVNAATGVILRVMAA
jgi:photosystem II stability/assembly factor-like uncharacterized protein